MFLGEISPRNVQTNKLASKRNEQINGDGFVFKERADEGGHSLSVYCMPDPGLGACGLASSNPHRGAAGRCPPPHHVREDTEDQRVLGRAETRTKDCPTSFLLGAKDS